MAADSDPSWAPGDEVDVLLGGGGASGKAQWWPGAIVGRGDDGGYRVRLQGAAGSLRPPRGCGSPPLQEEGGVTPGQLAPAGTHVPRWRLCAGGELVEVKVGGQWRRGAVFARYERRWFDAIVYITDSLARRVLISYLGWPKAPPNPRHGSLAEEWISFDSPRLRRPLAQQAGQGGEGFNNINIGADTGEWGVGDRVEVLIDQLEDDNRYVYWRYQGAYGRGVMGRQDNPLDCTLGVDVLYQPCTCDEDKAAAAAASAASAATSPLTLRAGTDGEEEEEEEDDGGAMVSSPSTCCGCAPSLGEAHCPSSGSGPASPSGGTSDGVSSGGLGLAAGTKCGAGAGAGTGDVAPTFLYIKASSLELAPPGTHLPVCTRAQLGPPKPLSVPAPPPAHAAAAALPPPLAPPFVKV